MYYTHCRVSLRAEFCDYENSDLIIVAINCKSFGNDHEWKWVRQKHKTKQNKAKRIDFKNSMLKMENETTSINCYGNYMACKMSNCNDLIMSVSGFYCFFFSLYFCAWKHFLFGICLERLRFISRPPTYVLFMHFFLYLFFFVLSIAFPFAQHVFCTLSSKKTAVICIECWDYLI